MTETAPTKALSRRNYYKLRGRVRRTIVAANEIDGRGTVVKIIWDDSGISGLVVRQQVNGLDGVQFQILHGGIMVLGKARVLLP